MNRLLLERFFEKVLYVVFICEFLLVTNAFCESRFRWEDCSFGILDLDIKTVDVCLNNSTPVLLAATDSSIYRSINSYTWELVYRIPGKNFKISEESSIHQGSQQIEKVSRNDFKEEDLRKDGVLKDDETLDDLSDKEFLKRLIDEGLIEEESSNKKTIRPVDEEREKKLSLQICWDPSDCRYAYLATSRGVFVSEDKGNSWRLLSNRLNDGKCEINDLTVLFPSGDLLVATNKGLFISKDHGLSFDVILCVSSKNSYLNVERDKTRQNGFLFVSKTSLFYGDVSNCKEIVITSGRKDSALKFVSNAESGIIALASSKQLWLYKNGKTENIPSIFWGNAEIRDVKFFKNRLYLATERGVFRWNLLDHDGDFINSGLYDYDIRQLACSLNKIYAASKSGISVYHKIVSNEKEISLSDMGIPPLKDLIRAAILFAELEVNENRNWFLLARTAQWIPELDLLVKSKIGSDTSFQKSKNISISSGNIYIGPYNQSWNKSDNDDFRIELELSWYPKPFHTHRDSIKISKEIIKKVKKQVKIVNKIKALYSKASQLNYLICQLESDHEKLILEQEFNRLISYLDALTGMYISDSLKFNRKTYIKGSYHES